MMITRTAISGIQTAQVRFAKSANKVVNAPTVLQTPPTEEYRPINPVQSIPAIGVQSTAFAAAETDFAQESVNMTTASFAYQANIDVLKTWDEMTKSLLSVLSA